MPLLIAALVCAVVCLPVAARGQPLLVGARVGGTSATQHLSLPSLEYDRRPGLTGGLAASLELRSWLSVQMDALYAQKGARLDRSYEMRIDYLEVPVLARLASPIAFHGFRPFLGAGLAPSVELRCSGYTTGPSIQSQVIPDGTMPLDCDSQRRVRRDRGRVFGGGIFLERGSRQFSMEVRRTRGQDISGFACCQLRNDVNSFLVGATRRIR